MQQASVSPKEDRLPGLHGAVAEWWRPGPLEHQDPRRGVRPAERDGGVAFWALMVFTAILLLAPQQYLPGLARLRVAFLTGGFGVAAYLWSRFAARRPLMQLTPEICVAAALLGWALLTIPLSEWPGGSLGVLRNLYIKALIIFWLITQTVHTLWRLRAVAWGLSVMTVPLALATIGNFLSTGQAGRIAGYDAPLTANPNDLALMLNLILPLTTALLISSRALLVRGLLVGLILLNVAAIVATFSRAGFLTLAVSTMLWVRALHRSGGWRWPILVLVLAAAALPFLPSTYVERISTMADIHADPTGSAQARWRDGLAATRLALDHPLVGAGMGMNVVALNELRGPTWQPVHNVYLEYAVDLGWPGLILFLLLFWQCIRSTTRVLENSRGLRSLADLSTLAEGLRITLVAFSVAAFFHPVAYHFYFYYFAGLAVALRLTYDAEVHAAIRTRARHVEARPIDASMSDLEAAQA